VVKLTVKRTKSNANETLGQLYIDDISECDTLEDEYREVKVKGETRIPAGVYKLKIREFGGFHEKYKKRFPKFHEGMIEICDIPGFTDVLIHCGNYDEDTMGCLLLGQANIGPGGYSLTNSSLTYEAFYKKVIRRLKVSGGTIEYIDLDLKK
jgi:hypothetical protein